MVFPIFFLLNRWEGLCPPLPPAPLSAKGYDEQFKESHQQFNTGQT